MMQRFGDWLIVDSRGVSIAAFAAITLLALGYFSGHTDLTGTDRTLEYFLMFGGLAVLFGTVGLVGLVVGRMQTLALNDRLTKNDGPASYDRLANRFRDVAPLMIGLVALFVSFALSWGILVKISLCSLANAIGVALAQWRMGERIFEKRLYALPAADDTQRQPVSAASSPEVAVAGGSGQGQDRYGAGMRRIGLVSIIFGIVIFLFSLFYASGETGDGDSMVLMQKSAYSALGVFVLFVLVFAIFRKKKTSSQEPEVVENRPLTEAEEKASSSRANKGMVVLFLCMVAGLGPAGLGIYAPVVGMSVAFILVGIVVNIAYKAGPRTSNGESV